MTRTIPLSGISERKVCLSQHKKRAPKEQREKRLREKPLREQRKVFWSQNKQHRQTVTLHLPIYWGTTRLLFIQLTELEPSVYLLNFSET